MTTDGINKMHGVYHGSLTLDINNPNLFKTMNFTTSLPKTDHITKDSSFLAKLHKYLFD